MESVVARRSAFISPRARSSYLDFYTICRSFTSFVRRQNAGQFRRSDFSGQGFTGYYETGQPTPGPLGSAYGMPQITPKLLKEHLDEFVVGQDRAKKVLSVAVYNHYQRVMEMQRREDEEEAMTAQQERRELARHPLEDEFPGQQATVNVYPSPPLPRPSPFGTAPILDSSPLTIEKSNVLLLGPSGVGKTLMAKTLARVLEVPFSMSDCTPFTQAGYIGEDAEVCVQRLLAAADYDVARAERGIICLDEIDKIATARVSHGKDVSGEGVQQALLKIIEGTVIQVQSKQERGSGGPSQANGRSNTGGSPTNSPLSGGGPQPGKGETYNVNTENILFICTGAFIGLHRNIMDRISRGSIGFGARVGTNSSSDKDSNDPSMKGDDTLFKKNLPFYDSPSPNQSSPRSEDVYDEDREPTYNSLDLTEPADLQKYGLIPEFVGRIPITCAVSSLSLGALVRVLKEPRNSLLAQYQQLFQLSGMELQFTSGAMYEVAKSASGMGTGARGLKTVMERLLGEAMFETPGSTIRYVLVTEKCARREEPPIYLGRGMQERFHSLAKAEDEEWLSRRASKKGNTEATVPKTGSLPTFEQYREKVKVAGAG